MTLRAVFVDLGGVVVRTEDRGPRARLAERLGMSYRELEKIFFETETSRRASIGEIPEEAHWQAVAKALNVSREEMKVIGEEFFAGDRIDMALLDLLRSLHPERKTGLISNAWSGLRPYILSRHFEDAFDQMIISAEVGLMKPDPRIYQLALDRLNVAPLEAVFLDDMPVNVEGAKAIGMHGINFAQPQQALDELKHLLNNHR